MKRSGLSLTIGLITAVFAFSCLGSTEEKINKTLQVQPGGTLVVDVDFGAIEVTTHSSDAVIIDVWRKVSRFTKSQEEAFLKDRPVEISLDDGTVTIKSKAKSRSWKSFSGKNEAKYTVRVPAEFNARLATSGGGIKVSDLTGDLKANTSGGALAFSNIRGPIDGGTSGGAIRAEACEGTIKVNTSGGSIGVSGGSGTLQGSTSGGGITVKAFDGPAKVHTSGGSITVEDAPGIVEASTSGGPITASLTQAPREDMKLSTSGGSIKVRLPDGAAFTLDAETSGGSVSSELPVTVVGKQERNRLKGAVNGGGKLLHLRTSGGGIEVRKLPNT